MKKVKYLSLIMIMVLMLTGCGSPGGTKNNEKNDNKPIAVNPPSKTGYTGFKKIVYLDPTNLNKKCTETDINSEDETKTGCMKWYAYKEDNDTYTMILDHDTTSIIDWVTREDYISVGGTELNWDNGKQTDKGPITAEKRLENDTSNWDNSLNARIIKVSEIREILGNNGNDGIYFETNTPYRDYDTPYPSPAKYGWLFDRTSSNCKDYGCLNNATGKSQGYWTDTPYNETTPSNAFLVDGYGNLARHNITNDWRFGIRPVITVQKSSLSFVETNE